LHDETFYEPKFRADSSERNFEEWISSYGDVPISATGKAAGKAWKVKSSLGKALRRTHGSNPQKPVVAAIEDIEAN
jgi:hypothetical protein